MTTLPPPTVVQDAASFDELLRVCATASRIAVDTEADSFFSYREKVCLIQVTAAGRDFLVDPLANLDIAGFGDLLADPERTKVFHDGEYDVLILKRDYGFRFAGLFDTRVAAAALGDTNPGLASVLQRHFGVELDKSMQRSDWGKRPLSPKQIDYARLDTHYLIDLMDEQVRELDERDRRMIVDGECRRLEALEPPLIDFDPDEFVRIKGATKLSPLEQRVLRELFALRNRLAAERDVPPFRVVNNSVLLQIARDQPRSLGALEAVRGFSSKQVRRMGRNVLTAVKRGLALGPLESLPSPRKNDGPHLDDEGVEVHDGLKRWRKKAAEREGFDAALVLNRHVLARLAARMPASRDELDDVEGLLEWQRERYGGEILDAIAAVRADWKAGRTPRQRRRQARRRRS